MLRKVSTSSIIISLVLLTFASVTALAQTQPAVHSFDVPTTNSDILRGIIIVDAMSTAAMSPTKPGTIWSAPTAASDSESAGGTSQGVSYTLSNGMALESIIIIDKSGQSSAMSPTKPGTIWSAPTADGTEGGNGASSPQTIIFTDYAGTRKGVMVSDRNGGMTSGAKGVMVSDRNVLKSLILNDGSSLVVNKDSIIIIDAMRPAADGGREQSNEITLYGNDGTQLRGIIIIDKSGQSSAMSPTKPGTIWSAPTTGSDVQQPGGFDGQIVMLVDDNGSFLGLLYLGEGEMPFKGYILGSK